MNLEVDLTQQIADIDFSNFCLMYTVDGVVNLLNQTMGSSNHKSKSNHSGSPPGNNSPSSSSKNNDSKNIIMNPSPIIDA